MKNLEGFQEGELDNKWICEERKQFLLYVAE